MITIYKRVRFASAHQLPGHPKCGKLHGHNFAAEVWLTGEPQGKWHFVLDYGEIKKYFQKYDHSGKVIKVSSEELAKKTGEHFLSYPNVKLVKVRIWEGDTAYAEYAQSK